MAAGGVGGGGGALARKRRRIELITAERWENHSVFAGYLGVRPEREKKPSLASFAARSLEDGGLFM